MCAECAGFSYIHFISAIKRRRVPSMRVNGGIVDEDDNDSDVIAVREYHHTYTHEHTHTGIHKRTHTHVPLVCATRAAQRHNNKREPLREFAQISAR